MTREHAGDGLVEFGEPRGLGVEDVLDGEVEAAVAAEERSDPESWATAGLRSCMKSAPVTVVPGTRASPRTDAELVTCQVHDSATHPPLTEPSERHRRRPICHFRSDHPSRSHASCRSRVSGALPAQRSPGESAHLPVRSGGEHDGFDACDVGG